MNGDVARRSPVLLAIAAVMAATLVALTGWLVLSQNRFGTAATIEAYDAVDGSERWTAQFDVDDHPHLANDGVLLVTKDTFTALDGDGEVLWKALVPGRRFEKWLGGYVAVQTHDSEGADKALLLDATNGSVLWDHPGSLAYIGTEIVVIQRGDKLLVLASRSGERIARVNARNRNGFAVGDTTAAVLSRGTLTVYTVDGRSIDVLNNLAEHPRLEAVDDDVVVLSRKSDKSGRTVTGYDIETGAQVWQQRLADYAKSPESREAVQARQLRMRQATPILTSPLRGDGAWIVFPAEGPPEAIASVGEELTPIDGAVRYFFVDEQTFAVDAASNEVLWTTRGRLPTATTDGLAAFKARKRYTIVSAATGEKVAVVPRKGNSHIAAAGGRLVVDTGSKIVVVEPDGTMRDLYEQEAKLEAASAQYVAVSKAAHASLGDIRVAVLDIATGAEVFDQVFERQYGISLDGEMLIIRHRESTTTVDLTTGATTSTATTNPRQPTTSPDLAVVAFNPGGTQLLWTTEISELSSVGAIGDAIVISTPELKHS